MPNRGQSLELFFIDGTPDGILTAEIFNWTGHVLVTPRIRLAEALRREETSFTGVYILLGDSEESSLVRAYIGESDDVGTRIRNHDARHDWWTQAIIITSAANSLNKAHVRYLEARLIEEARRAGRMHLENSTSPARPLLSEASRANMEQFVEHVFTVLPAVRVDGFLVKTRTLPPKPVVTGRHIENTKPIIFLLKQVTGDVNAAAHLQAGEFIVQAGSLGRPKWIGGDHSYQRLFEEVVESGVYVKDGTGRRFAQSYAFSSPSAAGAVLIGRSMSGPRDWVLAGDTAKNYKQWETEQLSSPVPPGA